MGLFSVILDKVEIVADHSDTVQAQGCLEISGVVTCQKSWLPVKS